MNNKLIKELERIPDINNIPTKYLKSLLKRLRLFKIYLLGYNDYSLFGDFNYEQKLWNEIYLPWFILIKKILSSREHIYTSKSFNKKVRQICAKKKISKKEAILLLKK